MTALPQDAGQDVPPALTALMGRREAFWGLVEKGDRCWTWNGKRNPRHPYGQFYIGWDGTRFREMRAHRAAWALAHNSDPGALHVCHHCDNPICVNPAHLFLGTREDNMRDMVAKGRHASRPQTHCRRGHAFTPENTTVWRNKKKCRTCTNQRDRDKRSRLRTAI